MFDVHVKIRGKIGNGRNLVMRSRLMVRIWGDDLRIESGVEDIAIKITTYHK